MSSPPSTRPEPAANEATTTETQSGKELLVTYLNTSGEESCSIIRVADTYDETLAEACTSLAPWLPSDWQNRRRDFAREVRNRKGDMIWAAIQPALVLELARLGRLPELRLRVHPPTVDAPGAQSIGRPAANENTKTNTLRRGTSHPRINVGTTIANISAAEEKGRLQERENAPLFPPCRSPAPPAWVPETPSTPGATSPNQQNNLIPSEGEGSNALSASVTSTLHSSANFISDGNYEGALKLLRSAASKATTPNDRAQLFLWLGQTSCEIKEYQNASSDISIARNWFTTLDDQAGRMECDLILARIYRRRHGVSDSSDTKLALLLSEAQKKQLQKVEVSILCEICELGCTSKDKGDDIITHSERAQSIAQKLGDMWSKAEASKVAGRVSEANGDMVSALQSYSGALELYRGAQPRSPISPVKDLEAAIQRMRNGLTTSMRKSGRSRFPKLF